MEFQYVNFDLKNKLEGDFPFYLELCTGKELGEKLLKNGDDFTIINDIFGAWKLGYVDYLLNDKHTVYIVIIDFNTDDIFNASRVSDFSKFKDHETFSNQRDFFMVKFKSYFRNLPEEVNNLIYDSIYNYYYLLNSKKNRR